MNATRILIAALAVLTVFASPANADRGKVLITCPPSHMAMDDPLVHFGEFGASHWHVFLGSTVVDADTTLPEVLAGPTTCNVRSDHSAMWVPAVVKDGVPIMPSNGFYYLLTWDSARKAITPMPGLRYVGGDSSNTDADAGIGRFYCYPATATAIPQPTIPTNCGGRGFQERMTLNRGCWDGRRFGPGLGGEGVEARAHMEACSTGLRVPYVILVINWPASAVGGRLSSDDPLAPGGASAHGDFLFGWTFNSQGGDALGRLVSMCLNDGDHEIVGGTGNCVVDAGRIVRVSDGAYVTD